MKLAIEVFTSPSRCHNGIPLQITMFSVGGSFVYPGSSGLVEITITSIALTTLDAGATPVESTRANSYRPGTKTIPPFIGRDCFREMIPPSIVSDRTKLIV